MINNNAFKNQIKKVKHFRENIINLKNKKQTKKRFKKNIHLLFFAGDEGGVGGREERVETKLTRDATTEKWLLLGRDNETRPMS